MPAHPPVAPGDVLRHFTVAVFVVHDGCVLLHFHRKLGKWLPPGGHVEDNELPDDAALREVLEETGLEAQIVKPLDTIEYFFRAGDTLIHKKVDFYLMTHTGGELKPQLSEVDDVEWVELGEAIRRASFASEKKLLESAQQQLEPSRASS